MSDRPLPKPVRRPGARPLIHPIPTPEAEKPTPVLSTESCQKCGAKFRWERSNADSPKSPLVLRLVEGSAKCNCGYGKPRSSKRRPPE